MAQWIRCYWDEEEIWFLFEIDADGWVTRQVELQGPDRTPIAAASAEEWQAARDAGRSREYEATYGLTTEVPVSEWQGHAPERLPKAEFEDSWAAARRYLERRSE